MQFLFLAKNITHLFPVQSETFDFIYDGEDVMAQASKSRNICVKIWIQKVGLFKWNYLFTNSMLKMSYLDQCMIIDNFKFHNSAELQLQKLQNCKPLEKMELERVPPR